MLKVPDFFINQLHLLLKFIAEFIARILLLLIFSPLFQVRLCNNNAPKYHVKKYLICHNYSEGGGGVIITMWLNTECLQHLYSFFPLARHIVTVETTTRQDD